ncbi:MAG: hypothetical protein ACRDRT_09580, partial [Pseudonocardiaceae bacterium]
MIINLMENTGEASPGRQRQQRRHARKVLHRSAILRTVERDLVAWVVDVSTVIVGIAAVSALWFSVHVLKLERRQSERSWQQQIALEHHARIYEAASSLIAAGVAFTRHAESHVETQAVPDRPAGSWAHISQGEGQYTLPEYDRVNSALHHLYFLLPSEGNGQKLLNDLVLLGDTLASIRPTPDHPAGVGDLDSVLEATGLRDEVEMLVETESLATEYPAERLRYVRELFERYFRGRIGQFV